MQASTAADLAQMEGQVLRAVQGGNDALAGQLWERLLQGAPDHPKALLALSQRARSTPCTGRSRANKRGKKTANRSSPF